MMLLLRRSNESGGPAMDELYLSLDLGPSVAATVLDLARDGERLDNQTHRGQSKVDAQGGGSAAT
jgi:hypothetical protein